MDGQAESAFALWAAQVENDPNAPAAIDERRSVTRGQLDVLAATIAAQLPKRAKCIGIVMDHGIEQIAAMLAAWRIGAAYVPAEPSFPDQRISYMFENCKTDALITQGAYDARFRTAGLAEIPHILVEPSLRAGKTRTAEPARSDDLAYVLYTSGSTGRPKGVAVTNANVCHYARAFNREFRNGPGSVMLQYSVCSFDIFVEEVWASLLNGAAIAIPDAATKESLADTLAFAGAHGVTMADGFPYLLQEMNEQPELLPTSVKTLISGGDTLRARYVNRLLDRADVYNTYGPSETTVCAAYQRVNDVAPLPDGTYPIGHAVDGARIRILDEHLQPVEPGTLGEICISGGGVAAGYIGNPAAYAAAFTHDADGMRLYRSGDLGYQLPDGTFAFAHRKDHQVMILGKRVEPDGVESVLAECPHVRQGIVRAFADEHGLAYMAAYVVPEGGSTIRLSQLKRDMGRKLPSFMIPEFFVQMPSLPLNDNGKVDAAALPVVMKEPRV